MSSNRGSGPFAPARASPQRLKVFVYGDTGAGKTSLALQFPSPAVLDLEAGTVPYRVEGAFDVLDATTADEAIAAIDWLRTQRHEYRTLVLDPITVFWDALQKKWSDIFLDRKEGGKGHRHEFYELQLNDWSTIKADLKSFLRRLLSLDLNLVVTARQKPQYADGGSMRKIGETFDGERSFPYLFDVVLHLHHEGEVFRAVVLKDRGNRLRSVELAGRSPGEIYEQIRELVGAEDLDRAPVEADLVDAETASRIRSIAQSLGATDEQIDRRCEDYGARSVGELSAESAAKILESLEEATGGAAG